MSAPRTLPDVVLLPARPGELFVGNPQVRTWAVADAAFAELLTHLLEPRDAAELVASHGDARFRVVDAGASPFRDGLLGDPTGLDRDATVAGADELGLEDALALAERLQFAVRDEAAYADGLQARRNILDRARRGNVHQRAGEYVMLELRRRSVDEWWVDQKFTEDRRGSRPGPYLDVQWRFMTAYYDRERLAGRRVLDFGCGPGLFTRLFAAAGADVVGMDTNADHLEVAERLVAEDGLADRVTLLPLELPPEEGLRAAGEEPFDLVFLSDVLMFYFHSYDAQAALDPVSLLRALRERLAPGGVVTVLEPNGSFWQQPWLGAESRPMTILTEYARRSYGVTPTLEQLSRAAEEAGLAISRVRELLPADDASGRANGFAREFPLWWFFELRAAG